MYFTEQLVILLILQRYLLDPQGKKNIKISMNHSYVSTWMHYKYLTSYFSGFYMISGILPHLKTGKIWPWQKNFSNFQTKLYKFCWPSDDVWQHRSGSIMAQVMVCCLTAPSHYLDNVTNHEVLLHSNWGQKNFTVRYLSLISQCPKS